MEGDDDDGALGAAWGGDADADSGGPPPRPEDVEAGGPRGRPEPPGGEQATVDRIGELLQEHKTAFTVALMAYALLVMPWLYREGFELLGLAIGGGFLAGIVLVTVANARDARESLTGDERRGF